MKKLAVGDAVTNAIDFVRHWWAHARGKVQTPPSAAAYDLDQQTADVLHRQCMAEWKGGKR